MPAKPGAVAEYLACIAGEKRAALGDLCAAIRAAAPDAVEGVSYGMPAFLVNGKAIAGFIAAANHLSYFPMSGRVVAALAKDLKRFDASKGTIRFTPEKPLSAALVKKLIRARLAEIQASQSRKKCTKSHSPNATTAPARKKKILSVRGGDRHAGSPETYVRRFRRRRLEAIGNDGIPRRPGTVRHPGG
jgi:uncharacterized protein YdhG (YjbR/CyaY superfamily)